MAGNLSATFFTAAASGVVVHLSTLNVVFEFRIWLLLILYATALVATFFSLVTMLNSDLLSAIMGTIYVAVSFNMGFLSSMITYRLFFHRLRTFPGPFWAKISRFYPVYLSVKKQQYFLDVQDFHRTYGDFVRTGPRDLSILRASAVQAIYGLQSKCSKSNWYDEPKDKCKSLQFIRDPDYHKRRRRTWDRAFSTKALASYQPRLNSKIDRLLAQLGQREGVPVNASKWAMFFAFDVMGDLGLGKDFHMLERGRENDVTVALHDNLSVVGYGHHVFWLLHFLATVPGLESPITKFRDWCEGQVVEKQQNWDPEATPTDIFSWVLKDNTLKDESTGVWKMADPEAMAEDSRLIIVAGSDTTSLVIAHTLYYLIKNPHIYQKLQAILDGACPAGDRAWSYESVKSIPYLEGIINETLRLKPSVPNALHRETPAQGLWIDEIFIPGNVHVGVPTYALHHDERYWERPDEFWPERWMDEAEGGTGGKTIPDAFIPFSIGSYSCIGRVLALIELRSVLSRIALNFDLAFAPGETGEAFDKEVKDTFTLAVQDLQVVFSKRS